MMYVSASGIFIKHCWRRFMSKRIAFIICILLSVVCCWTACKDDVANTGESVLGNADKIIVLADTFPIVSGIDSCDAIISQADSFLLGELETDYGLLRASILTQLACPEGYSYPEGFSVDSVDSICLFMYYSSWVGDANSPMAINAYMMDKKTFAYSAIYRSDLNIDDYFIDPQHKQSVLTNHRIVVASEKLDSIQNSSGEYVPMIRMRLNDDFKYYFASIQSFESQDKFNQQFKGLLIETSFGSSTVLNISDIALGVYYHFGYRKRPTDEQDTIVYDMKAFYANSEVRTVNHLSYLGKQDWIESLQKDSDTYNYIIAPAGVYTRLQFPMARMAKSINANMQQVIDGDTISKYPYVNKAEIRIKVENVFTGTEQEKTRNEWLQPASYMLLIKEQSMNRFFKNRELPSDSCALLGALASQVDSTGNTVYYYSYDMSDFIVDHLRKEANDSILNMLLVPVTIGTSATSTATAITSVRQQQTMSATKIQSAKNGMDLKIVYSGF